jgi:chorismate dehydratase
VRVSSFPALRHLRVGCVRYLNARPLIHSFGGSVIFDHPSRLSEMLIGGELDVALVPVFTALENPDFKVVDGVAIATRGPVYSVVVAYRGCLKDVKTVAPDPASCTSNHLLKCLLAEFHGLRPEFVPSPDAEARLLIGDHAIAFRKKHGSQFNYFDLGEEWVRGTGLPFVFAVWLLRPDLTEAVCAAAELRELKETGMTRLSEIVATQKEFTPEFASRYLRENISFDLGEAEKAGIALFQKLLTRHGFSSAKTGELSFV